MYNLYSFINIPNFMTKETEPYASLGQIINWGRTFSLDTRDYNDQRYPDVTMVSIDSRRDNKKVEVTLDYYATILRIVQWIYERSIKGQVNDDPIVLKQELNAEFKTIADIKIVGKIAVYKHYKLPEYLEIVAVGTGEENILYTWLSMDNFIEQYPQHEHRVILPVEKIDLLAEDRDVALAEIAKITTENHNRRVDDLIDKIPETSFYTQQIDWHDKSNDTITRSVPFTDITNGPRGNNIDIITENWRDAILNNSKYDEDTWRKIFPTLFIPTEFYIVPIWDQYSLPNQVESSGLYSSTLRRNKEMAYGTKYFVGYNKANIEKNLCVTGSPYNGAMFISCGHEQNYKTPSSFDLLWPTYAAIGIEHPDFPKLPPKTQEFMMLLVTLFEACSVATETSLTPSGMTRVVRGGITYLTVSLNNVKYLCPIKKGFSGK